VATISAHHIQLAREVCDCFAGCFVGGAKRLALREAARNAMMRSIKALSPNKSLPGGPRMCLPFRFAKFVPLIERNRQFHLVGFIIRHPGRVNAGENARTSDASLRVGAGGLSAVFVCSGDAVKARAFARRNVVDNFAGSIRISIFSSRKGAAIFDNR
jgi:hypothetical protein